MIINVTGDGNLENLNGNSVVVTTTNIIPQHGNGSAFNAASNSTSYSFPQYEPKNAVDVQVYDDRIEITYIERAKYWYTQTITIAGAVPYSPPDKVYKEVYGCKDGKLTLLKTINGRINPPILHETYEFEEE